MNWEDRAYYNIAVNKHKDYTKIGGITNGSTKKRSANSTN